MKQSDLSWHDHVVANREARRRAVRRLEAENYRETRPRLYAVTDQMFGLPAFDPDDAA